MRPKDIYTVKKRGRRAAIRPTGFKTEDLLTAVRAFSRKFRTPRPFHAACAAVLADTLKSQMWNSVIRRDRLRVGDVVVRLGAVCSATMGVRHLTLWVEGDCGDLCSGGICEANSVATWAGDPSCPVLLPSQKTVMRFGQSWRKLSCEAGAIRVDLLRDPRFLYTCFQRTEQLAPLVHEWASTKGFVVSPVWASMCCEAALRRVLLDEPIPTWVVAHPWGIGEPQRITSPKIGYALSYADDENLRWRHSTSCEAEEAIQQCLPTALLLTRCISPRAERHCLAEALKARGGFWPWGSSWTNKNKL